MSSQQRPDPDIADVVRSPSLDGLIVMPHQHASAIAVMALLRESLPDSCLRRSASGIRLRLDEAVLLRERSPGAPLHWTPEALRFIRNRTIAAAAFERTLATVRQLREEGVSLARGMVHVADDSPLDDHQIVNVAAMTCEGSPGLCLFDEQGAGKTVSMIQAFDELVRRDEVDFLLIAAPKSMVGEWPKDFSRFTGDLYRVATAEGTKRSKRAALGKGADVLITNYETVVSQEPALEALLRSYNGRCAIAVDESFFIKSPDALRTGALRRLREWASRGYVLCGTPAPNSPSDLVQQFNFCDYGLAFGGVDVPDDRIEALPVVQSVIERKGLFIRNLKADVLPDLPGKTFGKILVDLQPAQRELYLQALRALADDLESSTDSSFKRNITNFLSQRALLLQLCSTPSSVAGNYEETPAKLVALDRVVEEHAGRRGEKMVIWSFYTAAIDTIVARYASHGVVRYDGTVSSVEDRKNAVTRFQTDDSVRIFVANPAAAGAGLTLHSARIAVYESMSNQAAHYLQSLDRIHRRGQNRPVEYVMLLCRDTIEEAEYQRLLDKQEAARTLLGDTAAPPVIRTRMLEEVSALLGRFES